MTDTSKTTHVASTPEQRRALASPIRLEIIGLFTTGGALSVAEMAGRMGRPAGAIYYHVRVLEKAGLMRRAGERPGTKRPVALYEPVASRFELAAGGAGEDEVAAAMKVAASAFRMAEKDLEAALIGGSARHTGRDRNFFAARVHCRVNRDTLGEINEHLRAIERIVAREARRKTLRPDADQFCSLTLALLPLRGRGSD